MPTADVAVVTRGPGTAATTIGPIARRNHHGRIEPGPGPDGNRRKDEHLRILTYAGAILQYSTSYGYWGIFGAGLLVLVLVLMTCIAIEFFTVWQAKKFDHPSRIFHYYCGKRLGTFFDFFSIPFVFLSFSVMISGAGAVFQEYYGLSKYIGGIGLAVAVGIALLQGLDLPQASTNWFMSGLSYVGFCMLWLAAFLTALGKTAHNRKEAVAGVNTVLVWASRR